MRTLHHYGYTLIEVLISLLLLSLTLLGFDGIMLISMRQTQAAHDFTLATQQLMSMAERLRALDRYEGLQEQINTWNLQNKQLLPKGVGFITGEYPSYTIVLHWGKEPFHCEQLNAYQVNCLLEHVYV